LRHGFDNNGCGRRGGGRKLAALLAMTGGRGFPFGGDGPFGGDFPFGGGRGDGRHGGGRGPGGGPGRGRRGMFGREELRLLLLGLIAEEPRHGYDLIRVLQERSGGHYAPSPGVIYPSLALLADEGLIIEQPGDDSRRRFALSEAGQALLTDEQEQVASLAARLAAMAERARQSRPPQVERAVANLAMALRQRLQQGGEDDLTYQIVAVLDEAAQRIERL